MNGQKAQDAAVLLSPLIGLGTLFVFYAIWAAMHDIAHGEADCTNEYTVLALSIPAFALLYRSALLLPRIAKLAWLGGTGAVWSLFVLGAGQVRLHPKYAADPTLALFMLNAGIPVLAFIGYDFIREILRLRRSPR